MLWHEVLRKQWRENKFLKDKSSFLILDVEEVISNRNIVRTVTGERN